MTKYLIPFVLILASACSSKPGHILHLNCMSPMGIIDTEIDSFDIHDGILHSTIGEKHAYTSMSNCSVFVFPKEDHSE